jgi:FO synthase
MQEVLETVQSPISVYGAVDRDTACALLRSSDTDLPVLMHAATELRGRHKGTTVSYSRKVFIPLTNLCRDYCRYCTFRKNPGLGAHTMSPEEVLEVARAGERAGCREALFSLGDKPELLFPEMRETLKRLGYKSTMHYLEAMCELVLRETGLLPHANPGLMSSEWIERLACFCPSLGLMVESVTDALLRPGAAHDNAPDKFPAKRLQVIEHAGKRGVPFTTGLLIGIGEALEDRVDTLFAIRKLHERYGHIQEVIVQNFRTKADIPMRDWPEPQMGEMLRTIAVARLILRDINVQAPPNLSSPDYPELLKAGINDWGGISPVTPDFINPEAPWPHLKDLQSQTEAAGFRLRHRLTVYPEFASKVLERGGLLAQRLSAAMDQEGYARGAAA